jgi:hypothetical protein
MFRFLHVSDTVGEFAKDYVLVVNSAMKRLRALSAAL